MHPISDATLSPCGACAAGLPLRHERRRGSADAAALLPVLAVAALATACALVLGVGSVASSSAALSASPGGAPPAISESAFFEGRCRA